MKVAGTWRYVYRAVDQDGQAIDVYVSKKRDTTAATRFFTAAIAAHDEPVVEVTTDKSPALAKSIREVLPAAGHDTTEYANNGIENDHGRLKARLRPMRGLQTRPDRQRGHQRPRFRAEPAPRALRTRRRLPSPAHRRGRVRRTRTSGLTPEAQRPLPERATAGLNATVPLQARYVHPARQPPAPGRTRPRRQRGRLLGGGARPGRPRLASGSRPDRAGHELPRRGCKLRPDAGALRSHGGDHGRLDPS